MQVEHRFVSVELLLTDPQPLPPGRIECDCKRRHPRASPTLEMNLQHFLNTKNFVAEVDILTTDPPPPNPPNYSKLGTSNPATFTVRAHNHNFKINVKKILAVINATYAVTKRKPEKIRLAGIRTLTSAIPVQRSNQLS